MSDIEKFWKVLQSAVASAAAVGFENTAILVIDKRNGLSPDNRDGWAYAQAPREPSLKADFEKWLHGNPEPGDRAAFMAGAAAGARAARHDDHQALTTARAEILSLKKELETERQRLTACGVVAMADTAESAAKARDMHPDYKSAACDDVARRVDECMGLRASVRKAEASEAYWKKELAACGEQRERLAELVHAERTRADEAVAQARDANSRLENWLRAATGAPAHDVFRVNLLRLCPSLSHQDVDYLTALAQAAPGTERLIPESAVRQSGWTALESFPRIGSVPGASQARLGILDLCSRLGVDLLAANRQAGAQAEQPQPRTDVVPGKVHCAVCGFSLIRTNLYVNSGTTGPGDERCEPCPNDGNPLLPVTWGQEAREAWKTAEGLLDRATAAEKALAAQAPAEPTAPIDMVLHCPKCHEQHIDRPDPIADDHPDGPHESCAGTWTNPPHRSHQCHQCGHIWRPADVPTNGVAAVKTRGKKDSA